MREGDNAAAIGSKKKKGRPAGKQKDGRTVSCYLRNDLYDGLVRYCEHTGLSKTAVIERAVQDLLEKRGGMQDVRP